MMASVPSPQLKHHRRMSSSNDKETLMQHLIPDPIHSHAPRRTASTAILVLFASTVLFIAWRGNGASTGIEQGIDWSSFKSVDWGNGQAPATGSELYGTVDATEDDHQAGTVPGSADGDDHTVVNDIEEMVTRPSPSLSEGTFASDVARRVSAQHENGTLSRYVWHSQLSESHWNKDGKNTLFVVGQSPLFLLVGMAGQTLILLHCQATSTASTKVSRPSFPPSFYLLHYIKADL